MQHLPASPTISDTVWVTVANGDHAEFSILGARDAVVYYDAVKGDYTELMRSFEWAWLREYYASRYSV
jgi:hypothetical protein